MTTIKSSAEIEQIFRTGKRVAHPLVIALVAPTPPGRDLDGRVAFIAGKRLGTAVRRNRGKRLLREAARAAGAPWPRTDVVLIARDSTLDSRCNEIVEAVNQMVRRAGIRP